MPSSTIDTHHSHVFAALTSDIKYACRQLIRRPAHTLTVIACLGVGIAASVGTFSVLTSLLYGDLPGIDQRKSIVRVFLSYDSATGSERVESGQQVVADPLSFSDFAVLRRLPATSAIEHLSAEAMLGMTAVGRRGPVSLTGAFVSGDFFDLLRTQPLAGRLLHDADELETAEPVAVVSDHFWRTHLDGRADAIGQPILVGGRSFAVVGVAPPRFHGTTPLEPGKDESQGTQVWLPLQHTRSWTGRPGDDEAWLMSVGRLRESATVAQVQSELSVGAAQIAADRPNQRAHAATVVRSTGFGGGNQPAFVLFILALVMSLPLTVLAIGCANVANLQLASAAERARELAVRLSLGATRGQLLRLLTIESLVRTVVAVLLSLAGISALMSYAQPLMPVELAIDGRVLTFAVVLSATVSLGTGLIPAWFVLRRAAAGQLKQDAQGGGLAHSKLRSALVVIQVALSLVLLSVTAVFLRTVKAMEASAPPALTEQVVADFDASQLRMTPVEAGQLATTLMGRLAADARVTGVSLNQRRGIRVGRPADTRRDDRLATLIEATPSWFGVMDVKLLTGRTLTAADGNDAVVISAALAETLSSAESPVGQTLQIDAGSGPHRVLVVGVVQDFAPRPMVARPDPVVYAGLPSALTGTFTVRVRSTSAMGMSNDFRNLLAAVDPQLAWTSLRRGDDLFLQEAAEMRATLVPAIGSCSLVALLLAATGLYAVIAYIVMLRRREIGVRLAIGAQPQQIVALVMRQAGGLIATGVIGGLALSVGVALAMRASFVAPISVADPLVYAPTTGLLLVIALVAAAIPARRAARVDPVTTLREQ